VTVVKPYVLFHARCRDGFGACWAAHKRFGGHAQYRAVRYGEPFPADAAGKQVFCFDFCYPPEELTRALTDVKPAAVEIHDHHQSAMQGVVPWFDQVYRVRAGDWPPLTVHFDLAHSGAVLAWARLHPQVPVPLLLRYVEDRDLWAWKLAHSRAVSAWIETHPMLFPAWDELDYRLSHGAVPAQVIAEGEAVLRYQRRAVEALVEQARLVDFDGHRVPVVNAPLLQSEVGEALCARYGDSAFAMTFYERADGMREWSLRSKGGFSVSELAQRHGGGGHPSAAGFRSAAVALPPGMTGGA
jgi:hypothetical protein